MIEDTIEPVTDDNLLDRITELEKRIAELEERFEGHCLAPPKIRTKPPIYEVSLDHKEFNRCFYDVVESTDKPGVYIQRLTLKETHGEVILIRERVQE